MITYDVLTITDIEQINHIYDNLRQLDVSLAGALVSNTLHGAHYALYIFITPEVDIEQSFQVFS